MNETPTYKTFDGSIITFTTIESKYQAILISPSGQVVTGNPSPTATYEVLVEEVILNYTGGVAMSYSIIDGSSPTSPLNNPISSFNILGEADDEDLINVTANIPRIVLADPVDPVLETSTKINQSTSISKNPGISSSLTSKLPMEVKLSNSINIKKEDIKQKLIPYALTLLNSFGPIIVQSLTKKIPYNRIIELASCPSSSQLLKLINKKNKLTRQINNLYESVKTLSTMTITLNTFIETVKLGISISLLNPYPVPASINDGINKLQKTLERLGPTVNIITITLSSFSLLLGIIVRLLKLLDIMIEKCSQSLTSPVPYETINTELMAFVNPSTGTNNNEVFNQDKEYKDFKLELKLDETNKTQYPKHYAQALNKQGVPVLKTDSSFASDSQTLINEIKFIIDSNPNLTAE